jgi:Glycosyl transferase family 2
MSEPGPARGAARLRDAIKRRVRGPYADIGHIQEQLAMLNSRLERIEAMLRNDVRAALVGIAAAEVENRERLATGRDQPDYERAWTETRPLVSVTIATLGREELFSRSLPSILGQTYSDLEVIVVGDGAGSEIGRRIEAIGDPRVSYRDLGPRQPWTDDPGRLWLAGATLARYAAVAAARGRWVVEFDDDDAMRPECVESLLDLARESRAEAVYGRSLVHRDGAELLVGTYPPREGQFSWAGGMYHAGLRFLGRQLLAADLGLPGDWWLAERMLRAGVRFAMREDVLCDVHGSDRRRMALEGGLPWGGGPSGIG